MKKLSLIALFSLLLITLSYFVWAEQITLTTYYPAPYGVYKEMRAKRMAIGDNYYQGSNYYWPGEGSGGTEIDANADLIVDGNVGIGTTSPGEKLDVSGTVKATALTVNGIASVSGLTGRISDVKIDQSAAGTQYYDAEADLGPGLYRITAWVTLDAGNSFALKEYIYLERHGYGEGLPCANLVEVSSASYGTGQTVSHSGNTISLSCSGTRWKYVAVERLY